MLMQCAQTMLTMLMQCAQAMLTMHKISKAFGLHKAAVYHFVAGTVYHFLAGIVHHLWPVQVEVLH